MKVFFDTNVYAAEAILGGAAEELVNATVRVRWRIYISEQILEETRRVLVEKLGFSHRLGQLSQARVRRRGRMIAVPESKHQVSQDPADSPILKAAIACGADLLVTNDRHLLSLNPYKSLRIASMSEYRRFLADEGHLPKTQP
jgi:putative PIN family toxin of toxin-antitoxin system